MKKILYIAMIFAWMACEPRQGQQVTDAPPSLAPGMNAITAQEVIQAKSYTYVKGDQDGQEVWLAILKSDVQVGNTYYYGQSMQMKNFQSKELDRTFDSILFLERLSDRPDGSSSTQQMSPHGKDYKEKAAVPRQEMDIVHEKGEKPIGDVYAEKASLKDKKISVRGVVTKFNPGIMDRNWVHIQDGSGGTTSFDLTITTQDQVQVGTIVAFEGTLVLDKDFGHGYKYALLLEDATLLNKSLETKVN